MPKNEAALAGGARASKTKPCVAKPRKKRPSPKVNLALDRAEEAKIIDQIREEVEFHRSCAAELKTKLEELSGTAFAELLRVKELKGIIVSLKENGREKAGAEASGSPGTAAAPGPGADEREPWKRDLDRELEKLLVIKKLLEASLPAPQPNTPPAPPTRPDGIKRILVVDDDLTTVKIIAHFLEKENYRVSTSLSGLDGLKKALKEAPDLILLDVMMPDLNGFQFLSIYRKGEDNARTPVVFLSSLAEEADVLKGLETGAADYITKPFSPQVLMAKVKKNLDSRP
ncbi:MAG: hypothetical protein A2W03_14680 [Candidatus Aminicenantes bacterium RBG_16_63_16]|nr:MAG: hypothetical protein A2W03_14680 [Candidatus Aminicenantes bacterium RBG_16_63_16]